MPHPPPAGLEAHGAQHAVHLAIVRVGADACEVIIRRAQCAAQFRYIPDNLVQHQLLFAVTVHPEKLQQTLVTLAEGLEQAAGEAPIEKLDTAANGTRLVHLRKLP